MATAPAVGALVRVVATAHDGEVLTGEILADKALASRSTPPACNHANQPGKAQ